MGGVGTDRGIGELAGFERQPAFRDGMQDPRPDRHDGVIDLGQIVKAAEVDAAVGQGGQVGDGNVGLGWCEAQVDAGQAQDGFGKVVGFLGWGNDWIGYDEIDRGTPVVPK